MDDSRFNVMLGISEGNINDFSFPMFSMRFGIYRKSFSIYFPYHLSRRQDSSSPKLARNRSRTDFHSASFSRDHHAGTSKRLETIL